MTTDYDAPRGFDPDAPKDALVEVLNVSRAQQQTGSIGVGIDLEDPSVIDRQDGGLDAISEEMLSVPVVGVKSDEFVCSRCFLAHHRSRFPKIDGGPPVCTDCA